MIHLLYYRKKDTGEITTAYHIDNYSDELTTKIAEFNAKVENDRIAHLEEVSESSLTAYLYNTKQGEIKDFRQYLDDVANSTYSLERELNYIQGKIEEWERKKQ